MRRFGLWALALLLFLVPGPALWAEDDLLTEVRELLTIYYVDELKPEVLNAATVEEMIAGLNDPDTEYLSSEQYDRFIGSIDNESATGMIGVVIEEADGGLLVTDVLDGYSAGEQGVRAGDLIVAADGAALTGLTRDEAATLLRGAADSTVAITVRRGEETLNFMLTRRIISMPLAEGQLLDGHIGYVALTSFGMTMAEEFIMEANRLRSEGADCWLLDLRGNTGGYTEEALDLLGYFIGGNTAMIMEDYQSSEPVPAIRQETQLTEPIVLLTDAYSASSSEVVTGALRDYRRALLVGGNTYGSGKVKQIFRLSNGDYMKITIYRFFSPRHGAIDQVGIAPQLAVPGEEALNAGALLLAAQTDAANGDADGYIRAHTQAGVYTFSLEDLRAENYWLAGRIILALSKDIRLERGTAAGWEYLLPGLHSHYLYYPGYRNAGILDDVPPDKTFTLSAGETAVDWLTATPERLELIDAQTGRRLPYQVRETAGTLEIQPGELLIPGADYWLVLHGLKDTAGGELPPELALIRAAVNR
ncbi:MAG: PDZ domain-containing protein [Gracilibacteraceae bacterium]|jgi:carboxyl-terminal processing protease|nr:PDZ domain-containing protein [Gracilibacteraceae bacterium]